MSKSFSQPAPGHNIDDVVNEASCHSFTPPSIFAPQWQSGYVCAGPFFFSSLLHFTTSRRELLHIISSISDTHNGWTPLSITLAGTPTTLLWASTSWSTTLPEPTMQPSPSFICPLQSAALPRKTLSSTTTSPFRMEQVDKFTWLPTLHSCSTRAFVLMMLLSPITDPAMMVVNFPMKFPLPMSAESATIALGSINWMNSERYHSKRSRSFVPLSFLIILRRQ